MQFGRSGAVAAALHEAHSFSLFGLPSMVKALPILAGCRRRSLADGVRSDTTLIRVPCGELAYASGDRNVLLRRRFVRGQKGAWIGRCVALLLRRCLTTGFTPHAAQVSYLLPSREKGTSVPPARVRMTGC